MIQYVDQALERFLRAEVPLTVGEVDLSFDAPDREWGSGITRPTVNLFLWDVKRNAERARAGFEEYEADGKVFRRRPPVAIQFQYLTTAWAAELRDEHQLLGSVLQTVVGYYQVPAGHVPDALAGLIEGPITVDVVSNADTAAKSLWQALDGQLKPSLQLRVGMYVVGAAVTEAGPPTSDRGVAVSDNSVPSRRSRRSRSVEERPSAGAGSA